MWVLGDAERAYAVERAVRAHYVLYGKGRVEGAGAATWVLRRE